MLKGDYKWLVRKLNNEVILKNKSLFKGVVYDLGCGNKPYENVILPQAEEYIGVEWTNSFYKKKIDLVFDLNESFPVDDKMADTVVSFQVMEHLRKPGQFLKESYRILKSGGIMFLTVPFQWHVHEDPYDFFRYTKYGLEYLFKDAGFKTVEVESNGGFWATMACKFAYQSAGWMRGNILKRYTLKLILSMLWPIQFRLALYLDRKDFNERETLGYTVKAYK